MIRPIQLFRLLQINAIMIRHGLNRSVVGQYSTTLRWLSYLNPWSFSRKKISRGESIRLMLESLGPIFVKFGQLLSTRRDLLPDDMAEELAKLQDQVTPFASSIAMAIVEKTYQQPIAECFSHFEPSPLASASIAQVHAATLHDGSEVIVKILRPNITKTIQHDIALLYLGAKLTQCLWKQSRRLKPTAIVAEFERTIHDELDLMREAANASQLRRNFSHSLMLYVPKVYWEYTQRQVMVMERIHGIRISDTAALHAAGTDMKKLAEYGVEIFFTQVLRDSFFHADMHPGNLFVDVQDPKNPRYIGVDFGIMGSLSPSDQRYIAENLLAFFKRDYRRVALLHVESGWIAATTRIDQFESAIRTVCEPIFEKPLKDISFGQLLLRLFQTADRYEMEIQPQLLLLQKTLLNIEALGRELYPELDLWVTAKPFIEEWIKKQQGVRHFAKTLARDWPNTMNALLKTPHLLFQVLSETNAHPREERLTPAAPSPLPAARRVLPGLAIGIGIALLIAVPLTSASAWFWMALSAGLLLCFVGWRLRG